MNSIFLTKPIRKMSSTTWTWLATIALMVIQTSAIGQSVPVETVRAAECRRLPSVRDCGPPPVADGVYRLRARATFPDGRAIYLEVNPDGTYQQQDERNTAGSHFYFGDRDPQNCYRVEQENQGGRVSMPTLRPNREGQNAVVGRGITQVNFQCMATVHRIHWRLVPVPRLAGFYQIQNRYTGDCIDADNNDRKPEGKIQALGCRQVDNQFWKLEPVTR